ncbi:CDK-activating kinase assembly factor MAT1, partial [Lecanoromycetidae sp. Uapishka_2]
MSRAPPRNGVTQALPTQEDDICPVCKSSRYLNPQMQFKINPECYHKMCESCVDRIFSQGPAPCPVAGCAKTLRKQRFKKQTFESIKVEKEVDIRRRVAAIFNRRENEFETLLDYNNYLEETENLTFNLLNNIDVARTEATLADYARQNAQIISQNKSLSAQESASTEAQLAAQKEQARLRREAARQEEDEERREREEGRREIIDRIATSNDDPDKIAREGQRVVLKKSTARRTAAERNQQAAATRPDNGSAAPLFQIQGLKPIVAPKPEELYDAFGGYHIKNEYFTPRPTYVYEYADKARTDPRYAAGGFDVDEYCAHAIRDSVAGMGVFVEEEVGRE